MKNLIYFILIVFALVGCKPNNQSVETEILKQFEAITIVAKDFADRSYHQIHRAYANYGKKVEPYFFKAEIVYIYSGAFLAFSDSILARQSFSDSEIDSVLNLYSEVMDTLRYMIPDKHQEKYQIIQELKLNAASCVKSHPSETVSIMSNNVALNASRVQDYIFRSIDSFEDNWMIDHVSASTYKSADGATIVRLSSALIQSWPDRRTQIDSLFRNGKNYSPVVMTLNSKEFARVSLYPAESGNYRITGKTTLFREDGSSYDYPFDESFRIH